MAYSPCSICGEWHRGALSCDDARQIIATHFHFHVEQDDGSVICLGMDDDGQPVCPGCHKGHPAAITCPAAVDWRAWRDARKLPAEPTPEESSLALTWGPSIMESLNRAEAMERLERDLRKDA
jgi:hypothetical protein